MSEPKYKVGQRVWLYCPRKHEHGMTGIVMEVFPWDGPNPNWDTFCYRADWSWPDGIGFRSAPGERMVSDKDPLAQRPAEE